MFGALLIAGAVQTHAAGPESCNHPPVPLRLVAASPAGFSVTGPFARVEASVGLDGRVISARVSTSSGNKLLDMRAVAAMKQWLFVPARKACRVAVGTVDDGVGYARTYRLAGASIMNHDPIVLDAITPNYPNMGPIGHSAEVTIYVSVGADGTVRGASVQQSSGIPALDGAALAAARASLYEPAVQNGVPQAGSYLYRVDFAPN